MDAGGNFLVLWHTVDYSRVNDVTTFHAQLFNADGTARGSPFLVKRATAPTAVAQPAVAMAPARRLRGRMGRRRWITSGAVRGRRFDADGMQVGAEFVVAPQNSRTTRLMEHRVAMDGDGNFVVGYDRRIPDRLRQRVARHIRAPLRRGRAMRWARSSGVEKGVILNRLRPRPRHECCRRFCVCLAVHRYERADIALAAHTSLLRWRKRSDGRAVAAVRGSKRLRPAGDGSGHECRRQLHLRLGAGRHGHLRPPGCRAAGYAARMFDICRDGRRHEFGGHDHGHARRRRDPGPGRSRTGSTAPAATTSSAAAATATSSTAAAAPTSCSAARATTSSTAALGHGHLRRPRARQCRYGARLRDGDRRSLKETRAQTSRMGHVNR